MITIFFPKNRGMAFVKHYLRQTELPIMRPNYYKIKREPDGQLIIEFEVFIPPPSEKLPKSFKHLGLSLLLGAHALSYNRKS